MSHDTNVCIYNLHILNILIHERYEVSHKKSHMFCKNCRAIVFFYFSVCFFRPGVAENVAKEFRECRSPPQQFGLLEPPRTRWCSIKFCNPEQRRRAGRLTLYKLRVYCFRRRPRAFNRIDVMKFSSLDFFDRILAYSAKM